MPLTFPTDFDFVGVTPATSQFDLDRLTRHWRCKGATEEEVLAATALPDKGDVHPLFSKMFVTDIRAQESGGSACALDVNYAGALKTSGGNPVLPPGRHEDEDAVQSASSKMSSDGVILTEPITVQFYAPTSVYTWFSYLARGSKGTAADPSGDIEIIKVTIGDTSFSPGSSVIDDIVARFFTPVIVSALRSPEIVAAKYWQNTERRTKLLQPYVFAFPSGDFVSLAAPGSGYTVGDTLTITGAGGSAQVSVTVVGVDNSIRAWTQISDTMSTTQYFLNATGGTGSGAKFNNIHVS